MPPPKPRILYRSSAEEDLNQISDYILDNAGPITARRFIERIRKTCQRRAIFPLGAAEVFPGIRSFPVGAYVVFYRPLEDGLDILAVKHGRRDLPRLLRKELGLDTRSVK